MQFAFTSPVGRSHHRQKMMLGRMRYVKCSKEKRTHAMEHLSLWFNEDNLGRCLHQKHLSIFQTSGQAKTGELRGIDLDSSPTLLLFFFFFEASRLSGGLCEYDTMTLALVKTTFTGSYFQEWGSSERIGHHTVTP